MGKNPDNWFKFYPDPYIDDTRHLSEIARFVYGEAIIWMRKLDGPIPDDMRWMVCAFHSDRKKVRRGLDELIADGKLVRSPAGIINHKCMADIAARQHQREVNTKTARTRAVNRRCADAAQIVRGTCEVAATSQDGPSGGETINDIREASVISLNEPGSTRARIESQKLDREDSSPTPRGVGRGDSDVDEQHQQLLRKAERIKGGKVAKSARALRQCTGELDGSQGVTFVDGEITLSREVTAKLKAKFPGVEIDSICIRAAASLAKHRGAPGYVQAWTELCSAGDLLRRVSSPAPTAPATKRSLSREEQLRYTAEILASDEAVWNKRYGAAGPHQSGCLFTEADCLARLQPEFDKQNRRISAPGRGAARGFNGATHPAAGQEAPF